MPTTDDKTISDFGVQWTEFKDASGWWGSVDGQLRDQIEPLIAVEEIKSLRCCDIGAGMGRIVANLVSAGAEHVTAIEPSEDACRTLRENTSKFSDKVTIVNARGENVPVDGFDLITSLGVLHHIVDPNPVVRGAYNGLRSGGRFIVWLYGHEGNETYLCFAQPLRRLTRILPLWMLKALCWVLTILLDIYAFLCRFIPLPLRSYMREVYSRFDLNKRYLAIFDQLHTTYAKYYRESEARDLLEQNGFRNVRLHHRHGYSWTVVGEK
jgi:SAM-dependent methyltransferase